MIKAPKLRFKPRFFSANILVVSDAFFRKIEKSKKITKDDIFAIFLQNKRQKFW